MRSDLGAVVSWGALEVQSGFSGGFFPKRRAGWAVLLGLRDEYGSWSNFRGAWEWAIVNCLLGVRIDTAKFLWGLRMGHRQFC